MDQSWILDMHSYFNHGMHHVLIYDKPLSSPRLKKKKKKLFYCSSLEIVIIDVESFLMVIVEVQNDFIAELSYGHKKVTSLCYYSDTFRWLLLSSYECNLNIS